MHAPRTAILIYSGGLDSTTLLYQLLAAGTVVRCLGFDYGQRHSKELEAAWKICRILQVHFTLVNLSELGKLLPGSSQTDSAVEVPEGHYAEESMKKTVVPNRNMIMLSIAAGHALALGFEAVAYAAHSGDHAIYPDCRPAFLDGMNHALREADWKQVYLYAPYIHGKNKAQIVVEGAALGIPYQLTWTCYKGRDLHCGKCGSCQERKEAFINAGRIDPTEYEHV